MYDVIVIGGGPAGLQAALTLGRMHRKTLVLDSQEYRNEPAAEMHNFLALDGTPPAEVRAAARRDIAAYDDVEIRQLTATAVEGSAGAFTVTTSDRVAHRAARVLLATGVRDLLPAVPGLEGLFGTVAAHCPFCHGHEYAGGTVVLQGGPHSAGVALMMAPIAGELVVVGDGHDPEPAALAALKSVGGTWRDGEIVSLRADGDRAVVTLSDGAEILADGFFVRSAFEQSAPFAADLGLELLPSGCIQVDAFGRTSLPGVYAAGDLAHTPELPMPMASVLTAASAGLVAAASMIRDDVMEALG
ncbi:NAD(P)/FAD-dependent oxidoreductase [Nocardioides marmoriginsengisoli]|uniref:NAD(P)/FAD-dependent oxidoreductase n=1 Tax=Nocardioides marmoriginsengisoli TaxID=661483 RepID=A0A3N0CJW4_9ACTN|nr:NAD(P)/FAD-dependent oxidoreductase [Nocardioides marmoriginsengisoli]RNL63734.1 NAD(P)/FAD-dependent oxidoreductase [Nocardioides marmoriginsengisoli]